MVAKLKEKFIPKDYQINLLRRMQNLREKGMTLKEYTEEFYRLNSQGWTKRERNEERVSIYINDLIYDIQDEINMETVRKVDAAYQIALKEEEKLARKKSQQKLLHIKITHFNDDLLSSLQVSHFGRKCRKHHTFILPMSCLERHHKEHLKTPSETGLRRRNHLMKSTNIFP
jgi:hypothetical protein